MLQPLPASPPSQFARDFLRILDEGATPVVEPGDEDWKGLQAEQGTFYAFTSGSTGRRRPIRFSRERALANARAHAQSLGIGEDTLLPQTLPIHHPFGLIAYIFTPLAVGARLEPGVYFDGQRDWRSSVVHLTPYHIQSLMRRQARLSTRVGTLSIGSGPLQRGEAVYAQSLCDQLYVTYGLSQAGPRVSTGRVDLSSFVDGWIGHCLPGIDWTLDEESCLSLQSPYASLESESPLRTGDKVQARADGSWVFQSRARDVLRLRGQTVARAPYSQRVSQAAGLACEVCQRPRSDALVIFIEAPRPSEPALRGIRSFPELREATLVWKENFDRSVLGKVDLLRMLAQTP